MSLTLDTNVSQLTRVGKATASLLKKIGIQTVSDLIFYYPFRWEDLSIITPIANVLPDQHCTILGKITLVHSYRSRFKKVSLTQAIVEDKTSNIHIVWFNQPYLDKTLAIGETVYLSGKIDQEGKMVNPVYEKLTVLPTLHTARIVPLYSLTQKLTQKQLRFLIKLALSVVDQIVDYLPAEIKQKNDLCGLSMALQQIHFPSSDQKLQQALNRLRFDELFLFQLKIQQRRLEVLKSKAPVISFLEKQTTDFVASLPFKLTDSQKKAAWKIIKDMEKPQAMNRLLEGDVGSGKTVIATIALINCAFNNYQGILMAPTEILAKQHYDNIFANLKHYPIKIGLLTRTSFVINGEQVAKKDFLLSLEKGEISIVVGTHSLIQHGVNFKSLGLAIIDEQHRFGVYQRNIFREYFKKNKLMPHILSMTATPIPRSLALTLYGDLDLVVLDEMPNNRKKIATKVVDTKNRNVAYDFVRQQIKLGRQVFVVCPLIDPSDKLGFASATKEFKKLSKEVFPDLRVGLLHGKLKATEKEEVMADFLAKKYDILVSTSVIEVGVDVANASVMIIEGSERFGLAQLHQLRGRVGRSDYQSYCLLFTESNSPQVLQKLKSFIDAKNGFEVAELDLSLRGPGELYGISQSGWHGFKLAKLNDLELIEQTKKSAKQVLADRKGLTSYPFLDKKLQESTLEIQIG